MTDFRFTGNPFVDAGVAGMCAAASVSKPAELDAPAVDRAVTTLIRLMTSESAFKERPNGTKKAVFATSDMSVIFPNGPHANPSGKPGDKIARYTSRLLAKAHAATGQGAPRSAVGACSVDGSVAVFTVGNDEFPLVDSRSKLNFHPGLRAGQVVSAATALALEFFPLSVLRTGIQSGFFWFVHTTDPEIAVGCANLTIGAMNDAISRNQSLGFYGDWKIASNNQSAAFVGLIRDLAMGGRGLLKAKRVALSAVPTTAYVFSNDNRSSSVEAHDLPHELFRFFNLLNGTEEGQRRFQSEVLNNEEKAWLVAQRMMRAEPIARWCTIPANKEFGARLRGGWEACSLYATEVLKMSGQFIRSVEAASERITEHDDVKDVVFELRKQPGPTGLQWLSRKGLISSEEYQTLNPPEDRKIAFVSKDYLLAAVFERQDAAKHARTFHVWPGEPVSNAEGVHPLILLTEKIGRAVAAVGREKTTAANFARVRSLSELRGEFLRLVQNGMIAWTDFVHLFPPDPSERSPAYLVRDYVLAYLYDQMRRSGMEELSETPDALPEPTEERQNERKGAIQ
jgi:CRISPR-associated protein Cst1